ncbi:phosphoglycerol transferase MdoB-like AlkP superfamily enzyme [Geobacillus sp. C56-T2]|nr:phosphoglycerol transferase MdoB-like AlkP superfamily enzyme [Geobacillus sp. C56-T2]
MANFLSVKEIYGDIHYMNFFISNIALSLLCLAPLVSTSERRKFIFSFLLYLAANIIIYSDVVYERYYDGILSIEMITQLTQLDSVADSVWTLIKHRDILYFVGSILLVPMMAVLFRLKSHQSNPAIAKWRKPLFIGFLLMGMVLLFIPIRHIKPGFTDHLKVGTAGLMSAHLYDTYQYFLQKSNLAFAEEQPLTKNEKQKIREIKKYFQAKQAEYKQSPFYGVAKGKNLIMVQAESLNNFVVGLKVNGQEVTPHLNRLIRESLYFNHIYLQIGRGNTSDAEFVANNSLYPSRKDGAYRTYVDKTFRSLPVILKQEGYMTSAAHGNTPEFWNRKNAYKSQGYDVFYYKGHPSIGSPDHMGLGISDKAMFHKMAEIYKKQSEKSPIYGFIVTLSNHRPFKLPKEEQKLSLPKEFEGTMTGDYLQSVHYADEALGQFIQQLKKNGLWDETLFVYYGDHYGLLPDNAEELKRLLGITFDKKAMFNIPLVIHYPKQTKPVVYDVIGSQMDIFPTISSLMGIERPLYQLGFDLTTKHEGYVGFRHEIVPYTFFSDRYDYLASHDGIFTNGTCLNAETGRKVEVDKCRRNYERVKYEIEISDFIFEHDLFKVLP